MENFKVNRKEIRKALVNYKESLMQRNMLLSDKKVQQLYKEGKDNEAKALHKERYPYGTQKIVNERGIKLVAVMLEGNDEWKDIDPKDAWLNPLYFNRLLDIAEKV